MEMVKWRFLDTGKGNAFFNMALDEAILKAVGKDASPPTFRLYGWNPDAVTFGYSQDIERLSYKVTAENRKWQIAKSIKKQFGLSSGSWHTPGFLVSSVVNIVRLIALIFFCISKII